MGRFTDLLFAMPSFLEGAARTLDLGSVFDSYNYSPSPEEADALAIASDWYAIGSDLNSAIDHYTENRQVETLNVAKG